VSLEYELANAKVSVSRACGPNTAISRQNGRRSTRQDDYLSALDYEMIHIIVMYNSILQFSALCDIASLSARGKQRSGSVDIKGLDVILRLGQIPACQGDGLDERSE
jgi:hypothetical protein